MIDNKNEDTKSPINVNVINNPIYCSGMPSDFKNNARIKDVAPNPINLIILRRMIMYTSVPALERV
ncbi:Uncharacterised protein [Chlamydia trachomatis]|nr:Uncharacterised protein [Chlamydia trachomatis]